MGKGRLEAFSDGVLAIVITIMVLELKVPHSPSLAALAETYPVFLSYVLSFVYIGIYWNNHHHLFGAIRRVTGGLMWANLHLLFWLSLVPFSTAWMGENGFARTPSVIYGMNLFAAALAFSLVGIKARALEGPDSTLARSFGGQMTAEKLSLALYLLGIAACFVRPWLGAVFYAAVAARWFIPNREIERELAGSEQEAERRSQERSD